jgi:hypothetical protein
VRRVMREKRGGEKKKEFGGVGEEDEVEEE